MWRMQIGREGGRGEIPSLLFDYVTLNSTDYQVSQ